MTGFSDICNTKVFQDTVSEKSSGLKMSWPGPGPAPWARSMGQAHIGPGQGPYMGLAYIGMMFVMLICANLY